MNKALLVVLHNWTSLQFSLTDLREDQVKELLDYELENSKRPSFVERLHQRYSVLRAARERAELLSEIR